MTKGRRQRSPSNCTTNAAKSDANLGFVPSPPLSPSLPSRTARRELAKPLFPRHPASLCAFAPSLHPASRGLPLALARSPDRLPFPGPETGGDRAPRHGSAAATVRCSLRPSHPSSLPAPQCGGGRPCSICCRRSLDPAHLLVAPVDWGARSCATGARCLRGRWLSRAAIASVRFFSCSVRIRLVSSVLGLGRPFRLLVCDI